MRFNKFAVSAGIFAMTASAAMAADLPRKALPPVPVLHDTGETWYLRGDVGVVHYKRPEADFAAGSIGGSLSRENFADTALVGVGVGYRFSPSFRADVTVDHRFDAPFHAIASAGGGVLADRGVLNSSTVMLNGYWDIGTYYGFTPYVGAGIGVSRNVLSNHVLASIGPDGATWDRVAGGEQYNFAWALMAGVGYKLSSSFTLDLGYRYTSLGDMKTRYYGAGAGADVSSIGAHEVRLGLRYAFP